MMQHQQHKQFLQHVGQNSIIDNESGEIQIIVKVLLFRVCSLFCRSCD